MTCRIAVIADDLSGAAEVGAVARNCGLTAQVNIDGSSDSEAQVLVVDTDSRWRDGPSAAVAVESAARRLSGFDLVYKKVDSVLRGPVCHELLATMKPLQCKRTLLVPANPSFGRIIRDGSYLVDQVPLDQTEFAFDPEHPARSARVVELLDMLPQVPVAVLRLEEAFPESGIAIGEATNESDLATWAKRLDEHTLPAGAVGFFRALLEVAGHESIGVASSSTFTAACGSTLVVTGSRSDQARVNLARFRDAGYPVLEMPQDLESDGSVAVATGRWSNTILSALQDHKTVLVCISEKYEKMVLPRRLLESLILSVKQVVNRIPIDHLVVEGGATASSLVRQLGWKRFYVGGSWSAQFPGVVGLSVVGEAAPRLTIKPGSYSWPPDLLSTSDKNK